MNDRKRLGRGLAALLGSPLPHEEQDSPAGDSSFAPRVHAPREELEFTSEELEEAGAALVQINVYEIDQNPFQPRRVFSEAEIASLSESLKSHDMLQPILVRRAGDRYQLISGERRWRAAIQAGWETVPARLLEADDRLAAELAIIENLQREDLNPLEKALSFKRYLELHGCTQEELAQRLKINRATIANLVRLLELPEPVQAAVSDGKISAGHARALLPLGDEREQLEFSERIIGEGLSVRDIERLVQEKLKAEDPAVAGAVGGEKPSKSRRRTSAQIAALEQEFRVALGAKVEIKEAARGKGKIVIQFTSHEEFERLRDLLVQQGGEEFRHHAG